jgi:hypothetical protein
MAGISWQAMETVEIEQFLENSIIVIEPIASRAPHENAFRSPRLEHGSHESNGLCIYALQAIAYHFHQPAINPGGLSGSSEFDPAVAIDCAISVA